mmetsp:Transcript_7825/g.28796  ORF Transcript_7825/g.28796 Transcript_7825/m.28796 type:complete len:834 (+) Transcript_7825:114-2615(+)
MVAFSSTLARHRVPEWWARYIAYDDLKKYVNEMKKRVEVAPGTTSGEFDDEGGSRRQSEEWGRYVHAPRLEVELEDVSGEVDDGREKLWASLEIEYEPTMALRSSLKDCGLGIQDAQRAFFQALDDQVNKCNVFYEQLVDARAKALATTLKRMDVLDAALSRGTPGEKSQTQSESLQSSIHEGNAFEGRKLKDAAKGPRHHRTSSLTTTSGTDLYALFSQPEDVQKSTEAGRLVRAVAKTAKTIGVTNAQSREATVRALKHDVKEIYYALCMIQNFSTLNAVGIRKITKKMDKESRTNTSGAYCTACSKLAFWPVLKDTTLQLKSMTKIVEDAYLSCHSMMRKIEVTRAGLFTVESTHASHVLTRQERLDLLHKLRDTGKRIKDDGTKVNIMRDSPGEPSLYFAGGFLWGLALPGLAIPLWFLCVTCGLETQSEKCAAELSAFVTLRGVMLVFGQSLLWGPTVYVWQQVMVHWELIFFRTLGRTGLRAEHAILATALPWLAFILILTTSTIMWSAAQASTSWVKPLTMALFCVFVIPLPYSMEWADNPKLWFIQPPMKTRRFLARHFVRTATAPWNSVVFPDFFLADQLCSQSTAIADLLITFSIAQETSETRAIAATLPLWWRFLQCLRRARDSVVLKRGGAAKTHLLNAGKYSASIIAIWLRYNASVREDSHTTAVWIIAYVATGFSVCYSLTWDFFCDWSVLEFSPTSKWKVVVSTRRTLIKSTVGWTFAVWFNVFARSAGLFAAVPGLPIQSLSTQVIVTGLSGVEVVRRAIWNVFRVENEHSSNCGSFRAVGDSAFDALEDAFVHHVDELAKELSYVNPVTPKSSTTV